MAFAPRFDNLWSFLENTVRRHAARPAFGRRDARGEWRWTTWAEFGADVAAMRSTLASFDIAPGDRVAVISNNRYEWIVGAYACFSRRATWVPMYESMLDRDWKFILEDSGAKLVMVSTSAIESRIAALVPTLPRVQFDRDFDPLLAKGRGAPVPADPPRGSDLAYFIYTSGTTGVPKGVELSHSNVAMNVQAQTELFPLTERDRTVSFLPWAHVAGGSAELNSIVYAGGATAICERTDWLLETLPRIRPTALVAVPRIWNKIYDGVAKQIRSKPAPIRSLFNAAQRAHAKKLAGAPLSFADRTVCALADRLIYSKVRAKFGGELKYACSGAAALSPDVARFIDSIGIPVVEAYGMTEVSAVATLNPIAAPRIGSVGRPLPGVTVKIDETGSDADPAQGGEVIIYGHGVMAGYHNRPDETRAVMTDDGGLRSGDLGRFDKDGYLFITGRVKEIYKLENGKYVSPAPLEEKITLSPYVAQCMVHGQNKPFNVAVIVPDVAAVTEWARQRGLNASSRDALLGTPEVRALLEGELARFSADKGYERVEDFIVVPDEFTVDNDMLTPSLKVKRRVVVAAFGSRLEALYAQHSESARGQ